MFSKITMVHIAATINFIWRERDFRKFGSSSQEWIVVKHKILRKQVHRLSQSALLYMTPCIRRLLLKIKIPITVISKSLLPCFRTRLDTDFVKLNSNGARSKHRFPYGGLIIDVWYSMVQRPQENVLPRIKKT